MIDNFVTFLNSVGSVKVTAEITPRNGGPPIHSVRIYWKGYEIWGSQRLDQLRIDTSGWGVNFGALFHKL